MIGLAAGMICSQIGSPESHKGCLANQALAEQKAKFKKISMNGKEFVRIFSCPKFGLHTSMPSGLKYMVNHSMVGMHQSMYL